MPYIDDHALVENDVILGDGVSVWAFTQIRSGAHIGDDTTVGSHTYIDKGVTIGERCKIQTGVRIFHGVTVLDGVFIGPGALLTNDRRPRAMAPEGDLKKPEDWAVTPTTIGNGASLGAGAIIVAGCDVGDYAFVGAGAVVTRSVPGYAVVVGSPARRIGWVCSCGEAIEPEQPAAPCDVCGRIVEIETD